MFRTSKAWWLLSLPRSEPEKDTGMPPAESLVDVYFFLDSDKHCDDG